MVQPILRNASNLLRANPVSILKRPQSPTPFPFHATFSVLVSPRSPHVQFPPSPNLVATFTTHSSETYDRAPIKVSPNPLALPARGDRIFSPSLQNFTLAAPPKRSKTKARLNNKLVLELSEPIASPAITEFADPRSPKPHAKSSTKATPAPPVVAVQPHHVQFSVARPERSLSHALASYPRSPYPTAPIGSPVPAGAAEFLRSKASSKKSAPATLSVSSPITVSFGQALSAAPTPTTSGLKRLHKPAPLPLEPVVPAQESSSKLVDAFWQSVQLEGETPMVTALEYPASADLVDVDLKSPAPVAPSLTFGAADGSIWSPAVASAPVAAPKSAAVLSVSNLKAVPARESLLRAALLSPGVKSSFGSARAMSSMSRGPPLRHADVASPSPRDPFASFQSFASAMSFGDIPRSVDQADSLIAYPAPVATAA